MPSLKLGCIPCIFLCGTEASTSKSISKDLLKGSSNAPPLPHPANNKLPRTKLLDDIDVNDPKFADYLFRAPSGQESLPEFRKDDIPEHEYPATSCKCGQTERLLFADPHGTSGPWVPIKITWLPCPVHPCTHFPNVENEDLGPGMTSDLIDEIYSSEGKKKCLCGAWDQLAVQPEALEKYRKATGIMHPKY